MIRLTNGSRFDSQGDLKPGTVAPGRRGTRRDHRHRDCSALHQLRGEPAHYQSRSAIRRRKFRWRCHMGAHRSAGADAGRSVDDGKFSNHPQRPVSPMRSPKPISLPSLRSMVCLPARRFSIASAFRIMRRRQSSGEAQYGYFRTAPLEHACDFICLVGRYGRARLRHRRGKGRHAHVLDHAETSTGLLHSLG